MTYHLEQRGLEVVREASSTNAPHSLHDVSCVVMQMSGGRASDIARWKAAADTATARFFCIPHERNKGAWLALDEWIGRASAERGIPGEAEPNAAHTATLLRANATIVELEETIASLKKANAQLTDQIATGNAERDGLRQTADAERERANRLATHHAARDKQVAETRNALEGVIAAREREIETLKHKLESAAPKATALDALPGWLLPELTEESTAFAMKLHGLVNDGILEPHEARAKWRARFGGAS